MTAKNHKTQTVTSLNPKHLHLPTHQRPLRPTLLCLLAAVALLSLAPTPGSCQADIGLQLASRTVGRYQKLQNIILPAFFYQHYEYRRIRRGRSDADWFYPHDPPQWLARFAPTELGTYTATAVVTTPAGATRSNTTRFQCLPSSSKGFLRPGRRDSRFLEFSDGSPFFAIGQNLAFVGYQQYLDLARITEIFAKLARNGANFARIWTCCSDWAIAIEAPKSAFDRSWHRTAKIVTPPPYKQAPNPPKALQLDAQNPTIHVNPCYPPPTLPSTRYILSGRFTAPGPTALTTQLADQKHTFRPAGPNQPTNFSFSFTTTPQQYWLSRLTLHADPPGTIWLEKISLKQAGSATELLTEAELNLPPTGHYNLLDAFMLDKLLEAAEQHHIYLMLCLLTRDLYMHRLSDPASPQYRQALHDAEKFMRYAVARWGYCTHVAAWEYFNEMDPGKPTDRFYDQLGDYLERIDPYHHLRTTSTWHPSARDCRHPRLDIAQLHHYIRLSNNPDDLDERHVILEKARFLRTHAPDKPTLIGEFGLANQRFSQTTWTEQDTDLIHFHNALWTAVFAGTAGTPLFWWWQQLDHLDAYRHYQPLARYLAGISFAKLQPIDADCTGPAVELLGYQAQDRAYFWLYDPQARWYNLVVEKRTVSPISGATVRIAHLAPGRYEIQWWDTHHGTIITHQPRTHRSGPMSLAVPTFTADIACKILPAD